MGEVAKADGRGVVAEFAVLIYQARNMCAREGRMPAEQRQVQANAELRMFPRQRDGLLIGLLVHHQAGAGENAFAMGAEDGLVDGARPAEVVRVDDEPADGLRASHNSEPARR